MQYVSRPVLVVNLSVAIKFVYRAFTIKKTTHQYIQLRHHAAGLEVLTWLDTPSERDNHVNIGWQHFICEHASVHENRKRTRECVAHNHRGAEDRIAFYGNGGTMIRAIRLDGDGFAARRLYVYVLTNSRTPKTKKKKIDKHINVPIKFSGARYAFNRRMCTYCRVSYAVTI